MVQYYRDLWKRRSDLLTPLTDLVGECGHTKVTKKNKTQYLKLPSGEIVARIGYYAIGATGGGLKGLTASSFDVVPNSKYRITVTEARPLVTSYKIRIEQLTENDEAKLIEVVEDNVCVH